MLLKNKLARPEDALRHFEAALSCYRACLGEHKNTADCLENMAMLLEEHKVRRELVLLLLLMLLMLLLVVVVVVR